MPAPIFLQLYSLCYWYVGCTYIHYTIIGIHNTHWILNIRCVTVFPNIRPIYIFEWNCFSGLDQIFLYSLIKGLICIIYYTESVSIIPTVSGVRLRWKAVGNYETCYIFILPKKAINKNSKRKEKEKFTLFPSHFLLSFISLFCYGYSKGLTYFLFSCLS